MKYFLKNLITFALFGIGIMLVFLVSYIINDPFKVIQTYDNYSFPFVVPNRDYISTEMFKKKYPSQKYNSFIFGSSRTLAFRPKAWSKKLDKNDKVFMFDASGESLYGIYSKLKFLDKRNVDIKNALIIICRDVTFSNSTNQSEHLFIKHPLISGDSKLTFQATFFKAYLNPKFLFSYYSYLNSKKYRPYMEGYIEGRKIIYDTLNNAITIVDQEREITNEPTKYYLARKKIFYTRDKETIDERVRINDEFYFMLSEIKKILIKHKTNYEIVLSPLYEQKKFNDNDLLKLKSLFGRHVHDFSGKNHFTEKMTNYYETSHFRPVVGDSILDSIYKK